MLTENDIVHRVAEYLKNDGYNVTQRLGTLEKGVDIIAEKAGVTLYVEAKGETSSKEASSRYGKCFSQNQAKTHVAMAILASMKILASKPEKSTKVAIAFPANKDHKVLISSIEGVLKRAGIDVFMVEEDTVTRTQAQESY